MTVGQKPISLSQISATRDRVHLRLQTSFRHKRDIDGMCEIDVIPIPLLQDWRREKKNPHVL